jgi:F0F1-type ATP synthase membrane subunit c/vacuolar-type H+-ATPase subunit K
VGVAVGLAAWCITVLAGQIADGRFSVAVSDRTLFPYFVACAVLSSAAVLYATRIAKPAT